jgi:hypothetical protein
MAIAACLGACTRQNPAFGDGGAGTGAVTTTDTNAVTTGDDTNDPSVSETAGPTSTGEPPSSEAESGPDPGTTGSTETGSVAQCDDAAFVERSLAVTRNGAPDGGFMCPPVTTVHGVVTSGLPGQLVVEACNTCDVCGPDDPAYQFDAVGIPLPAVRAGLCIEVVVARTPDCRMLSIAISQRAAFDIPIFLSALDTENLPPNAAFPNGLEVPQGEQLCPREGCRGAGDYELDFGNASYSPGSHPGVPLFESDDSFDLDVVHSAIDSDCELRVAWDAFRKDG